MNKYSEKVRAAVAAADKQKPGVQLGHLCIKAEVPVQVVAKWFGVTRQGVYYWFTGVTELSDRHMEKLRQVRLVLTQALKDKHLPAETTEALAATIKQYRKALL